MKNNGNKGIDVDRNGATLEGSKASQKNSSKSKQSLNDSQSLKILQEVERLLTNNDNLQAINLLRALKDNMQAVKNQNLVVLTIVNLGILYYQVGFLQEANEEFALAIAKLKELSTKLIGVKNKEILRIKYETLIGKLELQVCILFSEMGKHQMALEHAKISSKFNYNLIYDILAKLYANLNKLLLSKNHAKRESFLQFEEGKDIINSIAVLNHLINGTKDLKLAFLQKQRSASLEQQSQITRKYGSIPSKIDMQMLYNPDEKDEHLWVYKNKILDEIQLAPYQLQYFDESNQEITKNEVIQKIAFLAISLYCYSTQTRFMEKQKNCDSHDVLDSQHWLSRSLEIAYSFMPPQAPILNQILTVHDRFHGLDKQTIPEDQQVTGFFKILKPLSKPKSMYNPKNPGCSPIMIRIQADKADLHAQPSVKTQRELPVAKNLIQLDQSDKETAPTGRNNTRLRGLSHGHRRIETAEVHTERAINSRATIDSPLSINGNIRSNYVGRKFGKRDDKLKVNFSDLHGKAIISEDLLGRPSSFQKKNEKEESFRSTSQRKKKSLPFRRSDGKRPGSLGTTIKYSGLELKGQKMEQALEADLFEKLHNETKMLQSARIGGNVYINNNINLYISKNAEMNPFGQTYIRGQVLHQKKEKDLSRRQMFLNKRRANNFVGEEIE